MKLLGAVLLTIMALPTMGRGGDLGPDGVKEAIAAASNKRQPPCYPIEPRASIGTKLGPTVGCVSTQYSRVVGAAREAATRYKPFAPADVTSDMLGPNNLVTVVGFAQTHGKIVSSVVSVVILPRGVKDPARAIQPLSTADVPETFKNAFGASLDGKGLSATFPSSALKAGEVHVIYDNDAGLCTDCKTEIRHILSKGMSVAELESMMGDPDSSFQAGPGHTTYIYGPGKIMVIAGRIAEIKW